MRSIVAFAMAVLASTSAFACDIGPQTNVKLDPKDRTVLISLGKAINAQELLKGTPVAAIFSEPSGVLTLNASDARTLAEALAGLRKVTACHIDSITMERILEKQCTVVARCLPSLCRRGGRPISPPPL